jgi:methionine-rich copper-binding protein CopC
MKHLILVMAIWLACPVLASAHAMLEHASPAAGVALPAPPTEVSLDFSEGLEPSFSDVSVVDAGGRDVTASHSSANGTNMRVHLKKLEPGTYKVTWHALSVDTHRTEGAYSFSVTP